MRRAASWGLAARAEPRTSTRCWMRWSASRRATRPPSPPVDPVTPMRSPAMVWGLCRGRPGHDLDAVPGGRAHEAALRAPERVVGLEGEAGAPQAPDRGVV